MPEEREERAIRAAQPEEIPWVVAYLREDIQDLRSDIRKLDDDIADLREEMNAQNTELRKEMNAQNTELRKEMNAQFIDLRKEISGQLKWTGVIVLTGMGVIATVVGWLVNRGFP